MREKLHPTRQRLLDTALALLDLHQPEELLVDTVLQQSGVSKGSLYHHFEDFGDLIETALVSMFAASVDRNTAAIRGVLEQSSNKEEFVRRIGQVTLDTQAPDMRVVRFRRARLLTMAEGRPRLMSKMSDEQARLTKNYRDLFQEFQAKGWINDDFDPQAAAVFIQAYTIGKIVDDVTTEPMDPAAWNNLIMKIFEKVFF